MIFKIFFRQYEFFQTLGEVGRAQTFQPVQVLLSTWQCGMSMTPAVIVLGLQAMGVRRSFLTPDEQGMFFDLNKN